MAKIDELRGRIAGLRSELEDKLAALVEIPSVSMEPARRPEMNRCAELAESYLRELGAQVVRIDTPGCPLVIGRLERDPSLPTVTVYNHLDVQPADPAEWKSPPFTFTRDGDRWFGRGTTDDKGPALTAMYGAWLAAQDTLPINIQFLWELEEEIGSPNFEAGLLSAQAQGFTTDSVVVSDTIWLSAGADHAPAARGADRFHGPVAARTRLPCGRREPRLGPGVGRSGHVLPVLPGTGEYRNGCEGQSTR